MIARYTIAARRPGGTPAYRVLVRKIRRFVRIASRHAARRALGWALRYAGTPRAVRTPRYARGLSRERTTRHTCPVREIPGRAGPAARRATAGARAGYRGRYPGCEGEGVHAAGSGAAIPKSKRLRVRVPSCGFTGGTCALLKWNHIRIAVSLIREPRGRARAAALRPRRCRVP